MTGIRTASRSELARRLEAVLALHAPEVIELPHESAYDACSCGWCAPHVRRASDPPGVCPSRVAALGAAP